MRATTVDIYFEDADYFAAHLSNGAIRIGILGSGPMYDVPPGHPHYARAEVATGRADVETLYDELTSPYLHAAPAESQRQTFPPRCAATTRVRSKAAETARPKRFGVES